MNDCIKEKCIRSTEGGRPHTMCVLKLCERWKMRLLIHWIFYEHVQHNVQVNRGINTHYETFIQNICKAKSIYMRTGASHPCTRCRFPFGSFTIVLLKLIDAGNCFCRWHTIRILLFCQLVYCLSSFAPKSNYILHHRNSSGGTRFKQLWIEVKFWIYFTSNWR